MSKSEKAPYVIKANYEQECREQLKSIPLALKGEGKSELEIKVGRKGCSKLSSKRMVLNDEAYRSHDLWSAPTQLGDGTTILSSMFSLVVAASHV